MQTAFIAFQGAADDGVYLQHTVVFPNANFEAFLYDRVGVEGFGTSTRPALVQVGNTMLMAWKGISNDGRIFLSTYTGDPNAPEPYPGLSVTPAMAEWTVQLPLIGLYGSASPGTSFGPALTAWNNQALMLWVADGDTSVWYTTLNGTFDNLVTQHTTNIRSAFTPAITNFNGTLIAVWRGEGDIDGLFWATAQDPANWYHHGSIADAATSFQPALTVCNGQVFLAFKGVGNDTGIYMTRIANVGDLPTNSAGWVYRWPIPNVGTSHGPSLCTLNSELFMAWKGDPGDTAIWYSSSPSGDQNSWAPQQAIGPSPFGQLNYGTSVGPALATFFG